MAKGKYYGPDKYKGVRPTGKDKYYGPNKYKGIVPAKKKNPLLTQAEELSNSKYAPVLKELELNEGTNTKLYTNAGTQRKAAIDREIGSINAAGATSKKTIGDLGAGNQTAYQQAIAASQGRTKDLLNTVQNNNSNMLSSLQAEIKARGGSPEDYAYLSPLTRNAQQSQGTLAAVGDINRSGMEAQQGLDQTRTTSLQAMADMMATTGASKARGAAQGNMDELYNNWLAKQQEIDTAQAKTKLEKADYTNNTYLTLKEKAAQAKAEKAQAALQASIAQGNLDFKNLNLQVKTQTEYDKMSAKAKQQSIENTLKSKGFSHKKAIDLAAIAIKSGNLKLSQDKFDWSKANPKKSVAINWNDLLAAGN